MPYSSRYDKRYIQTNAKRKRYQAKDEFDILASLMPITDEEKLYLDRVHLMMLTNNYIQIRNILRNRKIKLQAPTLSHNINLNAKSENGHFRCHSNMFDIFGQLFMIVNIYGQCMYVSENVSKLFGLLQSDLIGVSLSDFVHPCDVQGLSKALNIVFPIENTGIFDWNFLQVPEEEFLNTNKAFSSHIQKNENDIRSDDKAFKICFRIFNTLTNRRKSVRIGSASYRPINIYGRVLNLDTSSSCSKQNKWIAMIADPNLGNMGLDFPIDSTVIATKCSLDLKLVEVEELSELSYIFSTKIGQSWYLIAHPADYKTLKSFHENLIVHSQAISHPYRLIVNGDIYTIRTKANVFFSGEGKPLFIFCLHELIYDPKYRQRTIGNLMQKTPLNSSSNFTNLKNAVDGVEINLLNGESVSDKPSDHSFGLLPNYGSYTNLQKSSFQDLFSLYYNTNPDSANNHAVEADSFLSTSGKAQSSHEIRNHGNSTSDASDKPPSRSSRPSSVFFVGSDEDSEG